MVPTIFPRRYIRTMGYILQRPQAYHKSFELSVSVCGEHRASWQLPSGKVLRRPWPGLSALNSGLVFLLRQTPSHTLYITSCQHLKCQAWSKTRGPCILAPEEERMHPVKVSGSVEKQNFSVLALRGHSPNPELDLSCVTDCCS